MYITTKKVNAVPMTADAYRISQGEESCEDYKCFDGFLVTDIDGFQEWIGYKEFKDRYRDETKNMTFGDAIEYLKKGFLVSRTGWHGKKMYLFMRPEDTLPLDVIVRAKSLPDSFKTKVLVNPNTTEVKFGAYICMKCADGSICNGWLASQTDMLSEDWCIVNPDE